jgi:DsbC/DsbD-like thiol-disulfide interchange protein
VEKPGVKTLQLVCDQESIQPGKTIFIGLFIQHLPGYHTYWKAPGIVGVPTSITWELPEHFQAGEIDWPVPELTKMAQYTAYGYERDICLISEITVPADLQSDSVTLKAHISLMCCAQNCNPAWQDFAITFPVNRSGKTEPDPKWQQKFAEFRNQRPVSPPELLSFQVMESEMVFRLTVRSKETNLMAHDGVYCFCEDNQVHSDQPQTLVWSPDQKSLIFSLPKSGFGPENLKKFSGLLYHPNGWPGTSSKWILVSALITNS